MEETRNWLEMPHEIMGGMILQRLDAVEILMSVQKVCTTWRRICNDPAMWKVIDMHHSFVGLTIYDVEKLGKQAVDRSCGELIDISLGFFTTDDLLDHISRCSSKLNRLHLRGCHGVTGRGLTNAVKRLPRLETLELSYISVCAEDIEVIGRNCPMLKSFKIEAKIENGDVHAQAIATSMPALRHLKLFGIMGDDGVQAILNGCPYLESLDLSGCFYLGLDAGLEKLCRERIKDFKYTCSNIPEGNEDFDIDLYFYDDDALGDYGVSGGSDVSAGDDFD